MFGFYHHRVIAIIASARPLRRRLRPTKTHQRPTSPFNTIGPFPCFGGPFCIGGFFSIIFGADALCRVVSRFCATGPSPTLPRDPAARRAQVLLVSLAKNLERYAGRHGDKDVAGIADNSWSFDSGAKQRAVPAHANHKRARSVENRSVIAQAAVFQTGQSLRRSGCRAIAHTVHKGFSIKAAGAEQPLQRCFATSFFRARSQHRSACGAAVKVRIDRPSIGLLRRRAILR